MTLKTQPTVSHFLLTKKNKGLYLEISGYVISSANQLAFVNPERFSILFNSHTGSKSLIFQPPSTSTRTWPRDRTPLEGSWLDYVLDWKTCWNKGNVWSTFETSFDLTWNCFIIFNNLHVVKYYPWDEFSV